MWTLIVMLHAVSPNVPPSKGSIVLPTTGYEECLKTRDSVIRGWTSDRYRVSANCIPMKQ
jgi:hypothetical protein